MVPAHELEVGPAVLLMLRSSVPPAGQPVPAAHLALELSSAHAHGKVRESMPGTWEGWKALVSGCSRAVGSPLWLLCLGLQPVLCLRSFCTLWSPPDTLFLPLLSARHPCCTTVIPLRTCSLSEITRGSESMSTYVLWVCVCVCVSAHLVCVTPISQLFGIHSPLQQLSAKVALMYCLWSFLTPEANPPQMQA